MSTIFHSTAKGYITLEKTGKSESYVVWLNKGTAAKRIATVGAKLPYALTRAAELLRRHPQGAGEAIAKLNEAR